ncbi:MAG TPA: SCO family protein, partial [Gammaproteobacteria bacterium]|nr:SCO family protein [Gammaproteobacteria bacterium]
MFGRRTAAVLFAVVFCTSVPARAHEADSASFEPEAAIRHSQSAVGREVGDYAFRDGGGHSVTFAELRGKPLVVNLVYTSCADTCPLIVQTLARAVEVAQGALGAESFNVVTVGFDAAADDPARMHAFARRQGVDLPNWRFLSANHDTIDRLTADLGFIYAPSPRSFDHLAQISVLDSQGHVFQQIYGAEFDPPALVEPLKALALRDPRRLASLEGLSIGYDCFAPSTTRRAIATAS